MFNPDGIDPVAGEAAIEDEISVNELSYTSTPKDPIIPVLIPTTVTARLPAVIEIGYICQYLKLVSEIGLLVSPTCKIPSR